jgi:hypothetical protein
MSGLSLDSMSDDFDAEWDDSCVGLEGTLAREVE